MPAHNRTLPNKMENNSNQNQNRRRNNRSGGGNRNRQGGNRNRNQGGNRNRNRNRSRRRPEPKPTAMEKFLHTISFGLLGKAEKKKRKPQQRSGAPKTGAPSTPKTAAPKKKRTRTEVTSGRLYVGNLSYDADEPEIEELFKGAGNVLSAEVVTNARTQQSKGFAFVEMGSIDEAKRAVEILDDENFMGRKLIVSGARSEGRRDGEDEDENGEPAMAESGADNQA